MAKKQDDGCKHVSTYDVTENLTIVTYCNACGEAIRSRPAC